MEDFIETYRPSFLKKVIIYITSSCIISLSLYIILYFTMNSLRKAPVSFLGKGSDNFLIITSVIYSFIMSFLFTVPLVSVFEKEIKKGYIPYDPITKELQHVPKVIYKDGKKLYPIWTSKNDPKELTVKLSITRQLSKNVFSLIDTNTGHEYFIISSDLEKFINKMTDFYIKGNFIVVKLFGCFYIEMVS